MPKLCAYCDSPRKLSREHIWPDGFLRRGKFDLKYSARAGRSFLGDLTIRDVCNNGPLSTLDDYACKLYDSNFQHFPEQLEEVAFSFEYSVLTRWLLKISFNSARSHSHGDAELLARYREMILAEGDSCPLYANFFLALVAPAIIDNFDDRTGRRSSEKIYPYAARCGPMIFPNVNATQHVSARMIMINAYFFTMVLSRTPTVPIQYGMEILKRIPGEPLALDGSMQLTPMMNASQALKGVGDWPAPKRK